MTKTQEELIRGLRNMFKCPVIIEPCVVQSVDDDKLTCVVVPLDGPEILDVRLKAGIDEVQDGLVQKPTIGSIVLVALIGNDQDTRFVIAFSSVDQTLFNGGLNGGLINIQTLITELGKTNSLVNAIKDSLSNWVPVPNDGGAALKNLVNANLPGKNTGDFSDMEDDKVKH
jgi:hypothetical protein